MPTTVYIYDARDFIIDFKNGDGTTIYTQAPTSDDQSSAIAYSQTVTGGTMSMGGTYADIGTLELNFEGSPIETSVDNANSGTVTTGKTLFGTTDGMTIATGEDVDFLYEIRIYDPANPGTQISLYAVGRSDTYGGTADDGTHEIIGFASSVRLDKDVNYVVGDIYDNTEPAVRENIIEHSNLTPDPAAPPCFTSGTQIRTVQGDIAVEDLRAGDLVWTSDDGFQPISWIGSREISKEMLTHAPKMRPVRIRAGALGRAVPSQDLIVSQQHRILVRSQIAQRMFGTDEVLVGAKQLLLLDGVDLVDDCGGVVYYHLLFDGHQVVMSNGAQTESLFTGAEALKSVGDAAREEIFAIFPQLQEMDHRPRPARPLASGRMGRKLSHRHAQNHKPLINNPGPF